MRQPSLTFVTLFTTFTLLFCVFSFHRGEKKNVTSAGIMCFRNLRDTFLHLLTVMAPAPYLLGYKYAHLSSKARQRLGSCRVCAVLAAAIPQRPS
uniref:Uncharacterized protein n=1 Tax=Rhipicephalus microplus TaxID=6941 RepID=A0A6M2DCJ3_RHIMP